MSFVHRILPRLPNLNANREPLLLAPCGGALSLRFRKRLDAGSFPRSSSRFSTPVKKHLGLDDARSWIVIAEGNDFVWPGYDLRKAPETDRYEFGFLPPRFYNQVRDAFLAFHKAGQTKTTSR